MSTGPPFVACYFTGMLLKAVAPLFGCEIEGKLTLSFLRPPVEEGAIDMLLFVIYAFCLIRLELARLMPPSERLREPAGTLLIDWY